MALVGTVLKLNLATITRGCDASFAAVEALFFTSKFFGLVLALAFLATGFPLLHTSGACVTPASRAISA